MAQSTITEGVLPSLEKHGITAYAYPCRMPTLILVRHGRSTANTEGLLAGWTPGVALDERGAAQAAALPGRLDGVPISEVVVSPLQRCQETVQPLLDARPDLRLHTDERIGECHYGDWSGRKLA